MPWKISNIVEQRTYFISLARTRIKPFKHLCQQFGISCKTGYKWLKRVKHSDLLESVKDRSRRPKYSPNKTSDDIEQKLINLRKQYPYWGAQKIMLICEEKHPRLKLPSERTINRIFERNGLLTDESPPGQKFTHRFEYEKPNDLWQMDYKEEFRYNTKYLCYPLTVIDDHSRFNIVLNGHTNVSSDQTKETLIRVFKQYGMPNRLLMDRGSAWYTSHSNTHWTRLTVWLMRLGIKLIHSGAYHPQTLGKLERFHRTLKYDLIQRTKFKSLNDIQRNFDLFQHEYNYVRPHGALELQRPVQRYKKSKCKYPKMLPEFQYPENANVKKLSSAGTLYYHGKYRHVNEALAGEYVMLIQKDSNIDVFYNKTLVKQLNFKEHQGR